MLLRCKFKTQKLMFVTQTTLSVDETKDIIAALRLKYPEIELPRKDDICYATQNRQDAVKMLAQDVDLVLVVGSPNSSNSNRLRELAEKCGAVAYLVDRPEDVQEAWFEGVRRCGVTAGASAPEILVNQVIEAIQGWRHGMISQLEAQKKMLCFLCLESCVPMLAQRIDVQPLLVAAE